MTYRGILRCTVPLAAMLALLACAPTYQQQASVPAPAKTTMTGIVTPWGPTLPNSQVPTSAPVQSPVPAQSHIADSQNNQAPFVHQGQPMQPAPAHNSAMMAATPVPAAANAMPGMMLSPAQKTELDEARIALGILDRMANRCLTEADAASCTTLQVNWPNLSRQLRQSLGVISGEDFSDPIVPQGNYDMPASSSQMGNVPRRPAAGAPDMAPSMEKEIPMMPMGN